MSTNDSFEPERIVIETSAILVALLFAFTQLLFAVLVSVLGEWENLLRRLSDTDHGRDVGRGK